MQRRGRPARRRACSFLLVIIILLLLGLPRPPAGAGVVAAAQSEAGRQIVVFVPGINSKYELISPVPRTQGVPGFGTLKAALVAQLGYDQDDFVDFGYNPEAYQDEGEIDLLPYTCTQSGQDLTISGNRLRLLLLNLHDRFPDARLVLVGHSQGGAVITRALDDLATERDPLPIAAVVTLNSPLHGARSNDLRLAYQGAAWLTQCNGVLLDSPAAGQLTRDMEHYFQDGPASETGRRLRDTLYALHASGARVGTFGTSRDCVFNHTEAACIAAPKPGRLNMTWTQLYHEDGRPLGQSRLFNLWPDRCNANLLTNDCIGRSHTYLLDHPEQVIMDVIGPQGSLPAEPPAADAGGLIAFSQDNNIHVMNADGTGQRALTSDGGRDATTYYVPSANYSWFEWSPDGTLLAAVRDVHVELNPVIRDLIVIDPITGESRTLATRIRGEPAWSPSGRYVAVRRPQDTEDPQGHISDLELHDLETGEMTTLASDLSSFPFFSWSWAIDADELVVVNADEEADGALGWPPLRMTRFQLDGSANIIGDIGNASFCHGPPEPYFDPAWVRYLGEVGLFDMAAFPTIQWSAERGIALYLAVCESAVVIVDLQAGMVSEPEFSRALLSPLGVLAVQTGREGATSVGIAPIGPAAPVTWLGQGEQPVWSPDGAYIYFARRTLAEERSLTNAGCECPIPFRRYQTAIWRANADGTAPMLLADLDAFGTGPLRPTPDGSALVFSGIENSNALWENRLPGDRYDEELEALYPPAVRVMRLDLVTGDVTTLATNAGKPRVQPAMSAALTTSALPISADADAIIDLDDLLLAGSPWHLEAASDINNAGQIVGHGTINGETHAFLLTPGDIVALDSAPQRPGG